MKSKRHPTHDYSIHIETTKTESQYKDFSTFIDEKIHECRKKHFDGEARRFNRSTLAGMIGIDTSTLTKIINCSQATRKRDILIALCFALQLSESDAALALNLYPMAPLNRYNLRDLVIIQALYDKVSVRQLDDILAAHGFSKLNILRNNSKREEHGLYIPLNSTAYDEISVEIVPYCVDGNDSELSLHDRYRPDRYDFHSEMIIQKKDKDGPQYRILLNDYRQYDIEVREAESWKPLFSNICFHQKYDGAKPCNDPELLNEIAKLKEYTDRKARYIHSICNDTRNYISRFNAVNDRGRFIVYGESFGFAAPELSEYFQLEASTDGCKFTVSYSSRFLERYLGPETWMKFYGTHPSPVICSFKTLDEVTDERWKKEFQKLLQSACDLLAQIRERKLFLFNAHAWIDIDELMHDFHVEAAFECYQPDDLPYEIVPKKDQIIGPDGKPITVDDLYRAAELGIFSVEELCDIRTRHGSLEQFLQLEVLTEQKGKNHE